MEERLDRIFNSENSLLKQECTGCCACVSACSNGCISVIRDKEGFVYPKIEIPQCSNCGKCVGVCPIMTGKTKNPDSLQIGYAAFNKDIQIRKNSSSGGIFSLLAECVIKEGGVVFGVTMSDDFRSAKHVLIDSINELGSSRGSKYIQSTIGETFNQTKQELENGKKVLFTGTPCQISGLLSFLGKDYSNLYTQDIICHGVSSPYVWEKYIAYQEEKMGSGIRKLSFRSKMFGWKRSSMLLEFKNKKHYIRDINSDWFMNLFLKNVILRPSCYNCPFKTELRQSDITLADYWGIEKVFPDMDDNMGISFVWIHSGKGKELFDLISPHLCLRETEPKDAIRYNASAVLSAREDPKREGFFSGVYTGDFKDVINAYIKRPVVEMLILKYRTIRDDWIYLFKNDR